MPKMISYPTEPDVREAALDYLKGQLGEGHTLATLLREAIDFQRGKVMILSPVPLNRTQLLEFEWGHAPLKDEEATQITIADRPFLAYPTAGVEEQLAQVIHDWLMKRDQICLLENELAQAQDPWLKRAKSCIASYGVEIYHVVTTANRTATTVLDALREAASLPAFIGAIGPQPANPICSGVGHDTASMEQLRQFAMGVNCMFAQAYDGEGYVVWTGS